MFSEFCTKFCITKIVKWDFFGITIMEKQIVFCDGNVLNWNPVFHRYFWWNFFSCNNTLTGQISLPGFVYFPSCWVKCVSYFMLRHLMMSWYLNVWKVKIWFSHKQKEFSKWNKKTFYLVSQVLSFRLRKQTSKNVADIAFNYKKVKSIQNKTLI